MATLSAYKIGRSLEAIIIIGYSGLILISSSPAIKAISNLPILIYFLFIPGYVLTLMLGENYDILSRLLYSVLIGLALVVSLSSLGKDLFRSTTIEYTVIIPVILILLEVYVLYRKRG